MRKVRAAAASTPALCSLLNDLSPATRRCAKRSRAKKQLSIHEAPNVLAIQLKRFSYRSMFGGKISKFIAYPAKLSLKPFMSKNQVPPDEPQPWL